MADVPEDIEKIVDAIDEGTCGCNEPKPTNPNRGKMCGCNRTVRSPGMKCNACQKHGHNWNT